MVALLLVCSAEQSAKVSVVLAEVEERALICSVQATWSDL